MAKLALRRILIRDGTKLYRPLSFSFELDKHSEPFVKFILSDLAKFEIEQFTGSDPLADSSVSLGKLPKGLQEFSYHYIGGIMHFKHRRHNDLGYIQEERITPILSTDYIVKILRLVIYDIQNLKIYSKKVTGSDFVLPSEWSGKPRILSVYLAHTGPGVRLEIESSMVFGGLEITSTTDTNARLLITDEELLGSYPSNGILAVYIPNEKIALPDRSNL